MSRPASGPPMLSPPAPPVTTPMGVAVKISYAILACWPRATYIVCLPIKYIFL